MQLSVGQRGHLLRLNTNDIHRFVMIFTTAVMTSSLKCPRFPTDSCILLGNELLTECMCDVITMSW